MTGRTTQCPPDQGSTPVTTDVQLQPIFTTAIEE